MLAALQKLHVKNTFLHVTDHNSTDSPWSRQMSDPTSSATFWDSYGFPEEEKDVVIMEGLQEDRSWQKKHNLGLLGCTSIKNTCLETDKKHKDYPRANAWGGQMFNPEKINVTRQCKEKNVGLKGNTVERVYSSGSQIEMPPMPPLRQHISTLVEATSASLLPDFMMGESVEEFPMAKSVTKFFTVQHVPKLYTEELVSQELADAGFRHLCDYCFLCVPQDFCQKSIGILFIGFQKSAVAHAFESAYQGRYLRLASSGKALEVTPCTAEDVQRAALILRSGMVKDNYSQMRVQQPRFCQFCGNMLRNRSGFRPFRFCPDCGAEIQPLTHMGPPQIA